MHLALQYLCRFVLCALEHQCISPIGRTYCNFSQGRWKSYVNCHRYDQSVINILLSNAFDYNITRYTAKGLPKVLSVHRYPTSSNKKVRLYCRWHGKNEDVNALWYGTNSNNGTTQTTLFKENFYLRIHGVRLFCHWSICLGLCEHSLTTKPLPIR